MRSTLIVLANGGGHRLNYVSLLLREQIARGQRTYLLLPEDAPKELLRLHLGDHLDPSVSVAFLSRVSFRAAIATARRRACNLIVFPDGDTYVRDLAWRFLPRSVEVNVLVMRSASRRGRGAPERIRLGAKRLLLAVARRRRQVNCFDLVSPVSFAIQPKTHAIPDPITWTPGESPASLDPRTQWIVVVGALTPRKNIPEVIEGLLRAQTPHIGLFLAGMIDDDYRQVVQTFLDRATKAGLPIRTEFRPLEEGELDSIIGQAACVVMAHTNEGPSGILGKTLMAGTRVLAAGAISLREELALIPDPGRGWTNITPEAISELLDQVLQAPAPSPISLPSESTFARGLLGF